MNSLKQSLKEKDPYLFNLIKEENTRQHEGLELIASENFTSKSVMECLGSVLTNKYSEGLPNARYYGGNEVIDKIENLCRDRALKVYKLNPMEWGVNVQPYSGSVANLAAFNGILKPQDKIMGLDLPCGGHLTHGYKTNNKNISFTSTLFDSYPYVVDKNGFIDYDDMEKRVKEFKPKLIICGISAYSRDLDYKRFREIANINNSYLLCDMAHISGLVATQQLSNPFEYCDIVTTTTHKTLRGPRAGLIFYKIQYEKDIDFAVFPGLQGGPHQNQIAAVAHQLKEVMEPEFTEYIKQVVNNSRAMCEELKSLGYDIVTGGTDNHQFLVNLHSLNITGSKVEKVCEFVNISVNKNCVPGDKSALSPGGIRIGTPSLTTRGLKENDFRVVARFFNECVMISLKIQEQKGTKLLNFSKDIEKNEEIIKLKEKITNFSSKFPLYN